jgi:hypothetical protein
MPHDRRRGGKPGKAHKGAGRGGGAALALHDATFGAPHAAVLPHHARARRALPGMNGPDCRRAHLRLWIVAARRGLSVACSLVRLAACNGHTMRDAACSMPPGHKVACEHAACAIGVVHAGRARCAGRWERPWPRARPTRRRRCAFRRLGVPGGSHFGRVGGTCLPRRTALSPLLSRASAGAAYSQRSDLRGTAVARSRGTGPPGLPQRCDCRTEVWSGPRGTGPNSPSLPRCGRYVARAVRGPKGSPLTLTLPPRCSTGTH